jgi:hypothetical protein
MKISDILFPNVLVMIIIGGVCLLPSLFTFIIATENGGEVVYDGQCRMELLSDYDINVHCGDIATIKISDQIENLRLLAFSQSTDINPTCKVRELNGSLSLRCEALN